MITFYVKDNLSGLIDLDDDKVIAYMQEALWVRVYTT